MAPGQGTGILRKVQRIVIELKILRGNLDTLIEQGMEQVAAYGDKFNADEVHLVLFNRDPMIEWDTKIWQQSRNCGRHQVEIWECRWQRHCLRCFPNINLTSAVGWGERHEPQQKTIMRRGAGFAPLTHNLHEHTAVSISQPIMQTE